MSLSETQNDSETPAEEVAQSHEEVYEEPEIVEVYNGQTLEGERVAPGRYRWYILNVPGTEDDMVDVRVSRRVSAATANIYVNNPIREEFPTIDKYGWNPTKGPLLGPAGCYRIAVHGVPSFIEKDDMYLTDPSANWSTFDVSFEYYILNEEEKARLKAVSDQYKREKASSIWSNGYSEEVLVKYQEQGQSAANELDEKFRQMELQNNREISLAGTPIVDALDVGEFLGSR